MTHKPIRNMLQRTPDRYPMTQVTRIVLVIISLRLPARVVITLANRRAKELYGITNTIANPACKQDTQNRQNPSPPCKAKMDGYGKEDDGKQDA